MEVLQFDRDTLVAVGTAIGIVAAAALAGWRGVVKERKKESSGNTSSPQVISSSEVARLESMFLREVTAIRHELERVENRLSVHNGKLLDLTTRIDETTRRSLAIVQDIFSTIK